MITMVLVAAGGLMLTAFLMRSTASRARRDRGDGIRWRGIDWSRKPEGDEPPDAARRDD